ncbi:transglutaminase domain-containing protein [Paratractidigestivibacter sp.]|uniref:transglutaminase domain-containing protein n=1 Tax=Paratractidigestivibacter sp. TaxID=2847316 RepID=UPI002AC9881B|nr:transglutaminase domain-containing protein [Paratractidigestivibacter sp.]
MIIKKFMSCQAVLLLRIGLAACMFTLLALVLPRGAAAAEVSAGPSLEEVDFSQVLDAKDPDGLGVMPLDYDGQESTDAKVLALYQQFLGAFDECAAKVEFPEDATCGEVRRALSLVVANAEYYWVAPKCSLEYEDANKDGKANDDERAADAKLRYVVSDTSKIAQIKTQVEAVVSKGLALVDAKTMSDYQIALKLHDYVLSCSAYVNTGDNSCYTPYGALVCGKAVCQGYSLAYKLLLRRTGMECLYVVSKDMNHSWNLVQVEGEWYHADLTWDETATDHHEYFLKSDKSFKSGLTPSHYGWTTAHKTPDYDYARPMYRLYNKYTGKRFYTSSADERDSLTKVGWTSEDTGWTAPAKSGTPVYRLYNSYVKGGDHHYTTNEDEVETCKAAGWTDEGIGWYSAATDGVAVYRAYNPFAVTGTHHYTTKADELKNIVAAGWRDEKIAWYGL